MMIIAELIHLMFLQCSPDIVLICATLEQVKFFSLLFIFQILRGKSMAQWYLTTAWDKGKYVKRLPPTAHRSPGVVCIKSVLQIHWFHIVQAQKCSLSASGRYIDPCLIAAHMLLLIHELCYLKCSFLTLLSAGSWTFGVWSVDTLAGNGLVLLSYQFYSQHWWSKF